MVRKILVLHPLQRRIVITFVVPKIDAPKPMFTRVAPFLFILVQHILAMVKKIQIAAFRNFDGNRAIFIDNGRVHLDPLDQPPADRRQVSRHNIGDILQFIVDPSGSAKFKLVGLTNPGSQLSSIVWSDLPCLPLRASLSAVGTKT